jgi:hypothetical protein
MRTRLGYLTPLLGSVATAVAIAPAPIAPAAPITPQQPCASSGSGTVCQSPGNDQIDDAPPPVEAFTYRDGVT